MILLIFRVLAVLAALTAISGVPHWAQAQNASATVRLDGRALFRVAEDAEQDARGRARRIEQQLAAVLDNPRTVGRVRVLGNGGPDAPRQIWVSGREIARVTAQDAAAAGTSTEVLAWQWAGAIETGLQRAAARRLSASDRFLSAIQANVETAFARLLESAIVVVPRALAAALVLLLFWALATAVRWIMRLVFRRVVSDLTIENLIKQVGYYAVWALGLIVAAGAFGLELETVATGLGLTSLALGFALKDVLSNFVSGLLILILRPFELGDQIVIGDTEGSVQRINLRATEIRTYDGRMVSVPNAETFTSRVTNNTAAPVRRGSVECFVGYDTDLDKALEILRVTAQETEGVLPEPPASARVRALGSEDVCLEVRFWTDSRRSDYVSTASRVRSRIPQAFRNQDIDLPDGVLHIARMDEDKPSAREAGQAPQRDG